MRAAEDYLSHLLALQPPGLALPTDPDSQWAGLLAAISDEFVRVEARLADLQDEADPRTVLELIGEWERVAGLPDSCSGLAETVEARRLALTSRITMTGGQSRAYFIALAGQLGFPGAAITEFDPHTVDESVDAPIYGTDWLFAWKLLASLPPIDQMTVDASVDESLGELAPTTRLECVMEKLKPAHTTVLFEYT